MKRLGILLVAMGCAYPFTKQSSEYDSNPAPAPTVVQVREYPHSPTVEVVAWSPEENAYGFRVALRRDGTLVRDHRLYVSTYYGGLRTSRGSSYNSATTYPSLVQTVDSAPRLLLSAGVSRDDYACFYDFDNCSPRFTFAVRVPDELLREKRDSLAVRLYGRGGNEMIVTLYRDVIDPYLRTVDSVAAALRRTR
jgi:hypothetical protein